MLAGESRQPGRLLVHVSDHPVRGDGEQRVGGGLDQGPVVGLVLGQLALQPGLLGNVPRRGEDALHPALGRAEHRRVERHRRLAAALVLEHQFVVGHHAAGQCLLHARVSLARVGEILVEDRADEFSALVARHPAHLLVDVRDEPVWIHSDQAVHRRLDQAAQVGLLLPELILEPDPVGDVPGRGEDAAHVAVGALEHRCVERDPQVGILSHESGVERLLHACAGQVRIGEVVGEPGADELRPAVVGHLAHAIVDVADEPLWIDGDEAIHGRLDQAAQVGLLFP